MSYNKKEDTSSSLPRLEDGQVGIRATLNSMGFSNDRIGYNEADGTVTLDNRTLMKPGYLDEDAGVSYASAKDIQQSLVNFYQNTDNPIVRVSDAFAGAAGRYGLSADALTYGNGTVSVGGKPLDILYIDDEGKSWAWQNTVENSARSLANAAGVQSPTDLARNYENQYLREISAMVNQLQNREEFSYNPESDPVYLAYRQKYLNEGARASENAMATYAAMTGGYGNSAAVTAGAQAEQYYASQLANTIPQLAQQAYERYLDKYQQDVNHLTLMMNVYDNAYQNAVAANQKQTEYFNKVTASNVARDEAATKEDRESLLDMQTILKNDLTNQQLQTYLKYYEQLLQADLSDKQLNQRLNQAKIYQIYAK